MPRFKVISTSPNGTSPSFRTCVVLRPRLQAAEVPSAISTPKKRFCSTSTLRTCVTGTAMVWDQTLRSTTCCQWSRDSSRDLLTAPTQHIRQATEPLSLPRSLRLSPTTARSIKLLLRLASSTTSLNSLQTRHCQTGSSEPVVWCPCAVL